MWRANEKKKTQQIVYRSFNQDNLATFRSVIENISWSDVYNEKNRSIAYDIFLGLVKDKYDRAFPLLVIKKHTKSLDKPWAARELYKRIQARDKLLDKFIRSKDLVLLKK